MRAVPDIKCWLDNSRTAVVRVMPGTNTIRLASTTERTATGTTNAAIAVATTVASNAASASAAAAMFGRALANSKRRPIIKPITVDAATPAQSVCSIVATLPAETA